MARNDSWADAAGWTAADAAADDPVPQKGRRPQMTFMPWHRSQAVLLGATARNEWYWQCPHTGCKRWAGPYTDPITAKQIGYEHVYKPHDDRRRRK